MRNLETMTSDEKGLLLYFETRAVDCGGLVDTKHMNKEDMKIAKKWNEEGFIKFGRIRYHSIRTCSCWCEFTDEAWNLAHAERRMRCDRIMSRQSIDKI